MPTDSPIGDPIQVVQTSTCREAASFRCLHYPATSPQGETLWWCQTLNQLHREPLAFPLFGIGGRRPANRSRRSSISSSSGRAGVRPNATPGSALQPDSHSAPFDSWGSHNPIASGPGQAVRSTSARPGSLRAPARSGVPVFPARAPASTERWYRDGDVYRPVPQVGSWILMFCLTNCFEQSKVQFSTPWSCYVPVVTLHPISRCRLPPPSAMTARSRKSRRKFWWSSLPLMTTTLSLLVSRLLRRPDPLRWVQSSVPQVDILAA